MLFLFMGVVDFSKVTQAAWLVVPEFGKPEFNLAAILFMIPVAIADCRARGRYLGDRFGDRQGFYGDARPASRCLAMVWQSISLACSVGLR